MRSTGTCRLKGICCEPRKQCAKAEIPIFIRQTATTQAWRGFQRFFEMPQPPFCGVSKSPVSPAFLRLVAVWRQKMGISASHACLSVSDTLGRGPPVLRRPHRLSAPGRPANQVGLTPADLICWARASETSADTTDFGPLSEKDFPLSNEKCANAAAAAGQGGADHWHGGRADQAALRE
jgi:hypothetical protein